MGNSHYIQNRLKFRFVRYLCYFLLSGQPVHGLYRRTQSYDAIDLRPLICIYDCDAVCGSCDWLMQWECM